MVMARLFKLIGADGKQHTSSTPGAFGGHKRLRIYGRLDCQSALGWIAKGKYTQHRVFFESEEHAIAAGYRPCSVCMNEQYREWKKAAASRT